MKKTTKKSVMIMAMFIACTGLKAQSATESEIKKEGNKFPLYLKAETGIGNSRAQMFNQTKFSDLQSNKTMNSRISNIMIGLDVLTKEKSTLAFELGWSYQEL